MSDGLILNDNDKDYIRENVWIEDGDDYIIEEAVPDAIDQDSLEYDTKGII